MQVGLEEYAAQYAAVAARSSCAMVGLGAVCLNAFLLLGRLSFRRLARSNALGPSGVHVA